MKRFLCLTLSLVLALSLLACGGAPAGGKQPQTTAAPEEKSLQAGYSKVNITPQESVPLCGYGNASERLSQGLLDYLWATCLAVTDTDGETVLLYALDLGGHYDPVPDIRLYVAKELGLDESQVMFCTSHTHSAPANNVNTPNMVRYNEQLKGWLLEAGQKALEDRKTVTGLYYGSAQTEAMNFVRRYVMNDGTYAGDNYGLWTAGIKGHESEVDGLLQLVKLTREGGKDIVLTNFQTHPHRTGGSTKYDISADIVGVYRDELEKALDCHALYFTGAAGNINPTSRISSENVAKDYKQHGKMLASYGVEAAQGFASLELGELKLLKKVYTGETNHHYDSLLGYAQEASARIKAGENAAAVVDEYRGYGIVGKLHVDNIISKAKLPRTMDAPLYAVSLGEFSLIFAPFELFDQLGKDIREGSPFAATFICGYANEGLSYMPTELGWEHGGYGPYKCNFAPGTGEILVQEYIAMLEILYAEN